MALPSELIEAYRKAEYVVFPRAGDFAQIVFRIGEPNADLDELLDGEGASTAAFVCPGNKRGKRQGARENAEAFLQMNTLLNATRYPRFAGEGRDPDGKWPSEAGVLIAGMPRPEAEALGRALEQNAIVCVEKGRAPELAVLA